jgi:hypothetical protein
MPQAQPARAGRTRGVGWCSTLLICIFTLSGCLQPHTTSAAMRQTATPHAASRQNEPCRNMTLRKARAGEDAAYFYNGCDQPVLLIGSHTWSGPQDYVSAVQFKPWVLNDWLNMLVANGHNYSRGWVWDSPRATTSGPTVDDYVATPTVWARSNVCCAADGGNKFDLNQVNPAYLTRLKFVTEAYRSRNIYFSVMFFNGWSTFPALDGREVWKFHPFNGGNNINGLSIPHTQAHIFNSPSWPFQERYIRAVVAAVDGYDNVFYEVSNEDAGTVQWENQIVDLVHALSKKPIGHQTTDVSRSRADWWSIGDASFTRKDRVIFSDTDHLSFGSLDWLNKAYGLKHNPVLMEWWNQDESHDPNAVSPWYDDETVKAMRKRMGELRRQFEAGRPDSQCCSRVYVPLASHNGSTDPATR